MLAEVLTLQGPAFPDPRPSKPAPWCLYLAVLGVIWVPKVLPTIAARLGTLEARVGHLSVGEIFHKVVSDKEFVQLPCFPEKKT